MHMADALISPAVGGVMMAATAGAAAYSIKKIQDDMDEKKIPLMGVMGAFVFAAQMINFTIPGTGSSGHIGGGILLSALLGPYAGFLAMVSILLIQALFFGDGGLLAYGCNVINMGFYPCFIAYPLIYKVIAGKHADPKKIFWASLAAVVLGLQMGAFSVVLQTLLSGKTELPFSTFVMLMQPIHLAIGAVEGLVTGAIITFVWQARPEILDQAAQGGSLKRTSIKNVLAGLAIAALLTGGTLSWFASANPDGLEWAMIRTAGTAELESESGIHQRLTALQEKTAFLPDYGFKTTAEEGEEGSAVWSSPNAGTSVSGLLGGALTLLFAVLIGWSIRLAKRPRQSH
jgi:cobalt/nickel transport system permease protein